MFIWPLIQVSGLFQVEWVKPYTGLQTIELEFEFLGGDAELVVSHDAGLFNSIGVEEP